MKNIENLCTYPDGTPKYCSKCYPYKNKSDETEGYTLEYMDAMVEGGRRGMIFIYFAVCLSLGLYFINLFI